MGGFCCEWSHTPVVTIRRQAALRRRQSGPGGPSLPAGHVSWGEMAMLAPPGEEIKLFPREEEGGGAGDKGEKGGPGLP